MLPPLLLAYVGDAVFELYIRKKLVLSGARPLYQLHREAVRHVEAHGQSRILGIIEPHLAPLELDIVRRGRNTNNRVPKHVSMAAYRRATGLEALFGWLYLKGDTERLQSLFDLIDLGEGE